MKMKTNLKKTQTPKVNLKQKYGALTDEFYLHFVFSIIKDKYYLVCNKKKVH
jgi:hypothetical protein